MSNNGIIRAQDVTHMWTGTQWEEVLAGTVRIRPLWLLNLQGETEPGLDDLEPHVQAQLADSSWISIPMKNAQLRFRDFKWG